MQEKAQVHTHGAGGAPDHEHSHSHTQTKQVLRRIHNIIGHMHGISDMIEDERDCSEVLVQLSAVSASIRKLKTIILKDHVEHCIVDAVQHGDRKTLDRLAEALDKLTE